eukprot:157607-Lingulodinium_polyedra.AAC.1
MASHFPSAVASATYMRTARPTWSSVCGKSSKPTTAPTSLADGWNDGEHFRAANALDQGNKAIHLETCLSLLFTRIHIQLHTRNKRHCAIMPSTLC